MKSYLTATFIFATLASPSFSSAQTSAGERSGIDVMYIDANVRPQDDFFRYSQGKWLKDVEIPADRSSWGTFLIARDKVEQQVSDIINEVTQGKSSASGPDARKVADFYASFLDEPRRETLRLTPLRAELDKIAAVTNARDVAVQMARLSSIGVSTPFGFGINQDDRESTRYVVYFSQSGLGLPNRDYYLKAEDSKLSDTRAKYQQHMGNMLELAGVSDAQSRAGEIVAFETALAKIQWTAVENRDAIKTYNKFALSKLAKHMPVFDWPAYFKASGLAGKMQYVIISQPSYMSAVDSLLRNTPLPVLKDYFQFRLLSTYAPLLSQDFVTERFAFAGKVLAGAKEDRAPQKRATALVNQHLGEVMGKLYVAKHFPPERKQQVETMVKHFLVAFRQGIDTLEWMTPATKNKAKLKLSKMTYKIGYPNRWRDYSKLNIRRDDLVGNVIRARKFDHSRAISKLGRPIDRQEWHMTPQTVNAYYSPSENQIVFPAARLQAPLFEADADPAVNYGAVGISIGHEISHAFDDQGSKYDGDGNLNDWWTEQDREKFNAKGRMLVQQYNTYSPLPGYTINGELTLGENIADNAGAIMAMRAYRLSLDGKPSPVIDGFTGEQRLFMGLAQARRGKDRDAPLIAQIKSGPHSPGEFRVNGSLRNHPDFYTAFDLKPGDQMYLAPESRVVFW